MNAMLGVVALLSASGARPRAAPLPDIVFVSRVPVGAGIVPGLGPHGRLAGAGGLLLQRRSSGAVDTLADAFDAADADVSPDARRVAYTAREAPEARWRVRLIGLTDRADGGSVPAPPGADDTDPAWLDDSTLVFVRSVAGDTSLYDGSPSGQLWAWRLGARDATPLTHERNGVLDPAVDVRRGRLLFARWWFNPWMPAQAGGVARGAPAAFDSVNVWQLMSARPVWVNDTLDLVDERLAAGGGPDRRRGMGIQPAVLPDGSVLATYARNTGLAPTPGALGVQRFARAFAPGERIAGAAIGERATDVYREGANLAAPAACGPAALPDGGILVAMDRGARGDYGLWRVFADAREPEPVVDIAGRLELDPAPVVSRRPLRIARLARMASPTFRYENRDVFAGTGAPPRTRGARLVVFREGERIASAPVDDRGRVALDLPAGTPLFEMLVDSSGRALLSAHGPALVRGFNTGSALQASRCSGCHVGHSRGR